jgi:putative ABC transport system substrate-binding protein
MQFAHPKRRDFITLVGGAAAWPLAARAQQPTLSVIGFLRSTSIERSTHLVSAFRQGLKEAGYSEGENVTIEYRSAEGQYDRLPELAADLIQRQVKVIVATGGNTPALAVKALTSTIPIVFTGEDPVRAGLVASLNQPGGNATGVTLLTTEIGTKRLGLLHELAPHATTIALLHNPTSPDAARYLQDLQSAARSLGKQIRVLNAVNEGEIDAAFVVMARERPDALLSGADPFLNSRRDQIVTLVNHYKLLAHDPFRSNAASKSRTAAQSVMLLPFYRGQLLGITRHVVKRGTS